MTPSDSNPERTYHKNRQINSERYRNDAREIHRLDGPAYREWYDNGQLYYESWYVNGEIHRLDGPAVQLWRKDGSLWREEWYINDILYETEAEFQVAVDLYKANEIAELF